MYLEDPVAARRSSSSRRTAKCRIISISVHPEHFRLLRSKLARWADDYWQAVAAARPTLPAGLGNRAGDNWRELFRIGMVVDGTWPARLEAAALALSGVKSVVSHSEELLRDIKAV